MLNLFDIVRLYEGQNAGGSTKKTPESTTQEKQLIGRGVRYFPFEFENKIKNKRKFDKNLNYEMRILEELFYYTYDEGSRYISHLKAELKKDGFIRNDKVLKTFALKKEFKEGDFYKNTQLFYNEKIENPNRKKKNLEHIKKDFSFEYKIYGWEEKENSNVLDEKLENERTVAKEKTFRSIPIKIKDIEKHIFQKAIHIKAKQEGSLLQFEKLKKELQIKTMDDLQSNILKDFEIKIVANTNYENIANKEKLNIALKFLEKFFTELKNHIHPKIGGDFQAGSFEKFFGNPKMKTIEALDENVEKEILENDWYVLNGFAGTSEEKALVDFIKNSMGNLKEKYNAIYLLRNEEQYKIYNFKDGQGFAPDFLLFLKSKEKQNVKSVKTECYYQIFIEPKGATLLEYDNWKEKFLEEIREKYGFDKVIKAENPNYRLIGLPFFNQESKTKFETEFEKLTKEGL